jgi:S-methylmethionine-dependent homocysteine/selenocysteine methylase
MITISQIIKAAISSAAEAELEALFINCMDTIAIHHILKMGHKQLPTPMQRDHTTSWGVFTNTIANMRLVSMDTKLH